VIIIAGVLLVDPTERAAYLEAASHATAMARSAPGCLDFAQSPDPLDPERINIYERWETAEALQAFRDLPDESPASMPLIRAAEVRRYIISSVEDA
jgi:quinol monooxygenase YgiN